MFIFLLITVIPLLVVYGNLHDNSYGKKTNNQHVKSHGHKNFESAVRTYDKDLFNAALNLIDELKIDIRGFYHVSTTVGHWNEVLEEHLMLLDGKRFASSLFSSKASDRNSKLKSDPTRTGMKLSTGWSSVLEIVESVQVNFVATAGLHPTREQQQVEAEAYLNMTKMLSNLHIRGGVEKINVKPYHPSPLSKSKSDKSSAAAVKTVK